MKEAADRRSAKLMPKQQRALWTTTPEGPSTLCRCTDRLVLLRPTLLRATLLLDMETAMPFSITDSQ
ncbi:hypothetical protein JCM5350_004688 [Sporobolomyces pararoseus]